MEEAGDSAEFDGDGAQRGGGRRDRGSREPAVIEGKTSGEEETRSDRGGRGRRGRRDRGGNRDQQPSQRAARRRTKRLRRATPQRHSIQRKPEAWRPQPRRACREKERPGADGSRRWRGRRNRRRGRGRQQDGSQSAEAPVEENVADESSLEVEGAAAAEPAEETNESSPESSNRQDRNGRGDRGRGGRDRGDRKGRRAPRGFAPRSAWTTVWRELRERSRLPEE